MQTGMRISLIRHGETEANAQSVIQGHGDSPLTSRGHLQCKALCHYLVSEGIQFDAMYVSDLGRTQTTASYLLQSVKRAQNEDANSADPSRSALVVLDSRLRERRFEKEQGHSGNPESESMEKVWMRAVSMLCTVVSRHANHKNLHQHQHQHQHHVALVTHGGWIACVLKNLHVKMFGFPRNASISTLQFTSSLFMDSDRIAHQLRNMHVSKDCLQVLRMNHQPKYRDPKQRTLEAFVFHPQTEKQPDTDGE
eukprot:ANDGO_01765.mRNA.1 putative phosphoglycerate mutase GpmB